MPRDDPAPAPFSDELERWLAGEGDKTIGTLIDVFREKSFAVLFVFLLAVPAIPAPTGGATHVMEVIAALLALQLIAGRDEIWLPERWRRIEVSGPRKQRMIERLLRLIRRLERLSKPRMAGLFKTRPARVAFGLLVLGGSAAAFFAPPFTGLDTLPALGVVLIALAVLLQDVLVAAVGCAVLAAGVGLELFLGRAALDALRDFF